MKKNGSLSIASLFSSAKKNTSAVTQHVSLAVLVVIASLNFSVFSIIYLGFQGVLYINTVWFELKIDTRSGNS